MTNLVMLRYRIATLPDYPTNASAILAELEDQLKACEIRERLSPTIEGLILKAYTHDFLGDSQATAQILSHALSLGAQSGYIRLFADEGRRLLEVLEKHAQQVSAPKSYTKKIMDLLRQESSLDKPQSKVSRDEYLSPLTRRELDILSLLALGKSNQEIASERVLTLNTVKKHVANILSKLGVDNRTQAVMAARKAGWID
jgi:LuxR family maltose regulon positive regulatory protein